MKYCVKRCKTMCKRSSINWMRTVFSKSRINIAADCKQFVQEKNDYGILPQIYTLQN